jgi:hypothetical protein
MIINNFAYDDDYPTCLETWATFRIFHEELDPEEISKLLGIEPSYSYLKGSSYGDRGRKNRFGGWLLETQNNVHSRDIRRHIDWLLEHFSDKVQEIHRLQEKGYRTDVFCFWRPAGNGGFTISPHNTQGLSILNLQLHIDIG